MPRPERFPYQGKMLTIRELSESTGLTISTLRHRIKGAGMTADEAIKDAHAVFFGLLSEPDQEPPETFSYQGEDLTLGQLAKKVGISNPTLYQRIKVLGWTIEEATKQTRRIKPNAHMMTADTPEGTAVTKSMKEWSEDLGIPLSTISRRLGLGWTDNEALGFERNPERIRATAAKATEASRIARRERKEMEAKMKAKRKAKKKW